MNWAGVVLRGLDWCVCVSVCMCVVCLCGGMGKDVLRQWVSYSARLHTEIHPNPCSVMCSWSTKRRNTHSSVAQLDSLPWRWNKSTRKFLPLEQTQTILNSIPRLRHDRPRVILTSNKKKTKAYNHPGAKTLHSKHDEQTESCHRTFIRNERKQTDTAIQERLYRLTPSPKHSSTHPNTHPDTQTTPILTPGHTSIPANTHAHPQTLPQPFPQQSDK